MGLLRRLPRMQYLQSSSRCRVLCPGCVQLTANRLHAASCSQLSVQPAEAEARSQSLGRRCAAGSPHLANGKQRLARPDWLHRNLQADGCALWALHCRHARGKRQPAHPDWLAGYQGPLSAIHLPHAQAAQLTQTGWRAFRGHSVRSTFQTRRLQSSLQVATVLGSLAHQAAPVTSLECPSSR